MKEKGGVGNSEAPESYRVALKVLLNNEFSGSVVAATVATPVSVAATSTEEKKKKREDLGSMDQMVKWPRSHCHQCQYQLQFLLLEIFHLGETVEVAPLIILRRRTSLRSKLQVTFFPRHVGD